MSSEGKCPLNQLKGQVLALRKCRQLAISIILLTRQTTASCASPPHTDRRRGQKPSVSTSSVQVYNTINHLHLRSPELIWVIRMGPSFCIYKLNPAVTITLMFEEHTHTHTYTSQSTKKIIRATFSLYHAGNYTPRFFFFAFS